MDREQTGHGRLGTWRPRVRLRATRGNPVSSARASGNRHREAEALHLFGEVLRDLGRFDEAERALIEADAIARELWPREVFIAANTHSRGDLAIDRGDLAAAYRLYHQCIDELHGR